MVDMNSDNILEVPDTPDRIQQSACPVSAVAANPLRRRRVIFTTRNNSTHGSSSQSNACSVLPAHSDTDQIFKQAEAARILALSEDFETKLTSQKPERTTRTSVENEKRAEKCGLDQSTNMLNHISCSDTDIRRSPGCQVRGKEVDQPVVNHQNANFLGVGSGLPTMSLGKPRNRICTGTANRLKLVAGADVCPGTSSREIKEEVVTNKTIEGPSRPSCAVPQRHVGQKKLVRNGCISPSIIAKRSVKVDEKQEMCSSSGHLRYPHPQLCAFDKGNVIDLTDGSPRIPRPRVTDNDTLKSANNMETRAAKRLRTDIGGKALIPQSEYHANSSSYSDVSLSGCNNKGKEITHDILDSKRIGEACTRRVCLSAAGNSSVVNKNSSGMNPEQGWRTTHNHRSKLPVSFMGTAINSCEQESGSSILSNQDHRTVAGFNNNSTCEAYAELEAANSMRNKTIMIGTGRRKHTSASSHSGESSSAYNEPAASLFASSKTSAGRNYSSRRHDTPVITIDDMSPEAGPSSSGYSNVTSVDPTIQAQLEADELLARQLQEQLYNEAPRVAPTEEIDAIVAMSLQHEETAHQTSRPVRRFQNNTRGARASRSTSYRNAIRAELEAANSMRAELEAANSMISRLRNTAQITLGLGAVFPRYPGASRIQPNIDLNDYDALLALDENNHQHTGASEGQINNLPQSVVQSNNIEEPCAVCLENPTVGDTIRHLPCFHKFHKECIDEWLRRKKMCPVCKCGI